MNTLTKYIARFAISISTLIVSSTIVAAQTPVAAQDSIGDLVEEMAIQHDLDSLVSVWQSNNLSTSCMVLDTLQMDSLSMFVSLPDSVYIHRLSQIVSPIAFPYNSSVQSHIDFYTKKRRDQVETMLGLSTYYFPMFEAALDAQNLPIELKFLSIIESALNPSIRSRAGASGLWQFMYATGKMYGLEINSYVDERNDPVKSTNSAVRYLKDLYSIYGDWHLAIAAYNCGPGNVNKAIRRAGGKRDFWKIYNFLPRETRNYVPAFIAAAYTFTYNIEHNLYPKTTLLPIATDTVMIYKPLHFEQIAAELKCPVEYLRSLNPQYRSNVIPAGKKPYALRLAFNQATHFAELEDSIYARDREKYFANNQIIQPTSLTAYEPEIPRDKAKIYYTVKSGDAVGLIADKYNVNLTDLKYWNNINRNLIRVGQKLVIYVPKSKVDYYQNLGNTTYTAKPSSAATSTTPTATKPTASTEDPAYIYYTVRSGDNLWDIAQKYPGVTNKDIMALNNLGDGRKLSVGQKLKIKKKS